MLEDINEAVSSLLINRAEDYEKISKEKSLSDNNLTLKGGSW